MARSAASEENISDFTREYLEQLLIVLAIGSGIAILAKRVDAPYNVALVVVGLAVSAIPDLAGRRRRGGVG